MKRVRTGAKARASAGGIAVLTLVAGLIATPPAAAGGASPCSGVEIMPTADLTDGMTGTGLTVAEGSTPESFDVEILGVLDDALAPNRDLIIVRVSNNASIHEAGGIWAGMSGSPVYVDDKLVGAIAYSLAGAPSKIGGVTPAEDMKKLTQYEEGDDDEVFRAYPDSVAMPQSMEQRVSRSGGAQAGADEGSLELLDIPLGVSGTSARARRALQKGIDKENLPFVVHRAGSAAAPGAAVDPGATPAAGESFAAALSYGDVTIGAVGTTTFVCDGQAVAFGHPFFFSGETSFGANEADAITVVDDELFGPYKLATIGGLFGRIDQDRLAGVRALTGQLPELSPIESTITVAGSPYSPAVGESESANDQFLADVVFSHILGHIDSTYDTIDEGISAFEWTISGTTESGDTWSLDRHNVYSSPFDIAFQSSFEIPNQLFTLYDNPFEEIDFENVEITGAVQPELDGWKMGKMMVSKDGETFREREEIRARRGDRIWVKLTLRPEDGEGDNRTLRMSVKIPENARRRVFLTVGGLSREDRIICFRERQSCRDSYGSIDSFEQLIQRLERAPKNNEVRARLLRGRGRIADEDIEVLGKVVRGQRFVFIRLGGGGNSGEEPVG